MDTRRLRASVALVAALPWLAIGAAPTGDAGADPATRMQARYAAMKDAPGHDQFHLPLHLDSSEGESGVSGEINAIVDHPFSAAGAALNTPAQWCDLLILHVNTKQCRSSAANGETMLHLKIGKKIDQPIAATYSVDFAYRVTARTASYLQVKLYADEGPLDTRDYRIVLEAAPAENGRTLVRLSYSYGYGLVGRLAMYAYLATVGRNKVGFTVTGIRPGGQPLYVGGMRGVVERNTMCYFLALEAFLGALSVPREARIEKSFRAWYASVERYPRQLHEMEQGEYLVMKRKEYLRQQVALNE